jgi:hypothetical protein
MSPRLRRLLVPLAVTFLITPAVRADNMNTDPGFSAKIAHPMFADRHPQLLFDQGHHNTHTTRNRYAPLANLATADGFDVLSDTNPFAVADLKDATILLIANALGGTDVKDSAASKSAFTPGECEAVHQWVMGGGSLLLIAEHAPMGLAARSLAARFGVDFNGGYLSDPTIADKAFGASTLVFSDSTHTLGDHVILRGRGPAERVHRVRTYTGQSMSVPQGAVALLAPTASAVDYMLGTHGVSGAIPDSLKHGAAGRAQAIALTFGKGRVVMIGEATLFAAQLAPGPGGDKIKLGMNSPGFDNRQFAINVLRWLAHGLN